MQINRRGLLALMGAGGTMGAASVTLAQPAPAAITFAHGVASGDPAADGAVIWTRATADEGFGGDIVLSWYVSASADGSPVVEGDVTARASADHTAKVEVAGLQPGRDYYYWFTAADGTRSPTGRFRTLPVGATDEVVYAVASCQLWAGGFFNAYADMAALDRLDAVIHLGDYIYEYGADGYGAEVGKAIGRLPDPPHEIVTLADYRRRHAQVKTDPAMQAAHARAAFICVWDDHETANDSWVGGAENHQSDEGDWAARKAVAMQAYFEWMPIRDPNPVRAREAIFRAFEFGDLATLAMVETRLLARSKQVMPKGDAPPAEALAALFADLGDESREMLGKDQSDWLEGVLSQSVQAGKPWQVLGNQVVMAKVAGPDLEAELGPDAYQQTLAAMPEFYRQRIATSMQAFRAGVPFNLDGWDGYPYARERLYALFERAGSRPLVLAGDSHAAWTNNLHDNGGRLAAVEIGCTAITSPSYGSLLPGLGKYLAARNEEVVFCDQDRKGYALVRLTPERAVAEHVVVSTVTQPEFERSVAATFVADAGAEGGPFRPA
ncbi:alkaline phosphatase [Aurantiacibacter xanthus]|uniref:Alkaline phosphatase n=1 Tax=Aurantiacibacter xanthus TaxID=1784712 RepID=A0A3A1NZM1_9SPHN|nr:alkaline phosphatase D family protein [Aurantiacibacter xanthus]RIV81360.1 alkaline phosphatase [Aurantiacibacter xanthus]